MQGKLNYIKLNEFFFFLQNQCSILDKRGDRLQDLRNEHGVRSIGVSTAIFCLSKLALILHTLEMILMKWFTFLYTGLANTKFEFGGKQNKRNIYLGGCYCSSDGDIGHCYILLYHLNHEVKV